MSNIYLEPADFKSSVVAVPPIALTPDFEIAYDQNAALMRHIEGGGVRIVLYGGNANLYHYGLRLYRDALKMMHAFQTERTSVITSIGPDFGKMLDQAKAVREIGLRNVMLLPTGFPADPAGVANGARQNCRRTWLWRLFFILSVKTMFSPMNSHAWWAKASCVL